MENSANHIVPKAVIFGLEGETLSEKERKFFQHTQPLGFILFSRNCRDHTQIKQLTADLRACVRHKNIPILIDQEGGRVARLKPPLFRSCPSAVTFANLAAVDKEKAKEAVYLNARLMAEGLLELGINVDCAPVADLLYKDAHDIIGDRSFGSTVEQVVTLADAMAKGLIDGGVMPIMKHIPGHGRAKADSHEMLPVIDVPETLLAETDFAVFKQLHTIPWAMTAHIIYKAIDPHLPATLSPIMIKKIREEMQFKGVLVSDDLSMKALQGSFAERTEKALAAGCDIVLHCNGKMEEMEEIASHAKTLSSLSMQRLETASNMLPTHTTAVDTNAMEAKLHHLLSVLS